MDSNCLIRRELIGRDITVGEKKARIIDETKNTIIIKIHNQTKKLLKKNNVFHIIVGDKIVQIEGNDLLLRPEERIKLR